MLDMHLTSSSNWSDKLSGVISLKIARFWCCSPCWQHSRRPCGHIFLAQSCYRCRPSQFQQHPCLRCCQWQSCNADKIFTSTIWMWRCDRLWMMEAIGKLSLGPFFLWLWQTRQTDPRIYVCGQSERLHTPLHWYQELLSWNIGFDAKAVYLSRASTSASILFFRKGMRTARVKAPKTTAGMMAIQIALPSLTTGVHVLFLFPVNSRELFADTETCLLTTEIFSILMFLRIYFECKSGGYFLGAGSCWMSPVWMMKYVMTKKVMPTSTGTTKKARLKELWLRRTKGLQQSPGLSDNLNLMQIFLAE